MLGRSRTGYPCNLRDESELFDYPTRGFSVGRISLNWVYISEGYRDARCSNCMTVHNDAQLIHAKQELVGPCEPGAHFDFSVQRPMYRATVCDFKQSLPLLIREVTFECKHSTKFIDPA